MDISRYTCEILTVILSALLLWQVMFADIRRQGVAVFVKSLLVGRAHFDC
jgi:hypothetical protein